MKIISPADFSFLFLQSMSLYAVFDAISHNPQIWAAGLTLLSTLITVGFNLYKLYRDNKKTPGKFRLRGRRGKKHEHK
jgi:hypothetical protein